MKKLFLLILAVIMCLGMISTVFAAEIKFNDVKETDWFYGDVMSAVDMGLINGKGEGVYAPNDNLTYAEAVKLAACMHQLYIDGVVTLKNGTANWYDTYVDYCVDNGIITKEYNYNEKATRSGYMVIFAHALPDDALKAINNVPDNSIPDVPSSRAYAPEVYKLYRAGILQGSDDAHSCKPLDNIKRSEVAAILSRMMDETKRVKFSMGDEEQTPEETKPEETKPEENVEDNKEPEEGSSVPTSPSTRPSTPTRPTTSIALAIKTQPEGTTVKTGESATLSVTVEGGKAPYTYQWEYYARYGKSASWSKIASATENEVSVSQVNAGNVKYRCVITDAEGAAVTSEECTVTWEDNGFLMYVEDVFSVQGRGTVLTGKITYGEIKTNDTVYIVSADGTKTEAVVTAIEMFNKIIDEAQAGDNVGLLVPSVEKTAVARGNALIKADSDYKITTTVIGTLTLLSKADGGLSSKIESGYQAQFYYASYDETGTITLPAEGLEPGATLEDVKVVLKDKLPRFLGQTFEIKIAGRKIGLFSVTEVKSLSARPSLPTRPSTTRPSTSTALAYKTQPVSTTVNADEYATFTVEVTGGKAPYQYYWMAAPAVGRGQEYQWEYLGEDKAGAEFIWSTSSNTLKVRPNKAGIIYYRSIVIDANGDSVISNNVCLTAKAGNIYVEVSGTMSTYNDNDILALTANVYGGSGKYSYQWQNTNTLDAEDKWHNANYTTKTNKDNEPICYLDLDRVIVGKAENYYARVCVTDLETNKTVYSSYVRGIAVWGMDEFVISETKAIVLIKDRDKLAFEIGKEKEVELEVYGGKAPYTYRWEYSTDGTNFKSIPVEAAWADSVAKPNLKVTYDGVGIIKGNYLRCKVTDANGNVFYCEPLKVIRHFDFT